jgi:hypothetical protein
LKTQNLQSDIDLAIATAIATINASREEALAKLRQSRNKTKDL